MNKKKCALGLAAILAVTTGLTACDWPTESEDGSIFTYTDAQGNRVSYTADDLLNDYLQSGDSLSTEFDKVYEVLIRNYYQDPSQSSVLQELEADASSLVTQDKQTATNNANSNNTSFEEEFERILSNAGVDNVDELYQYHLYELEQERFQEDIYQTFGTGDTSVVGTDAIRDGYYMQNGERHVSFPASEEWGIGDDGWLKEQMPYHVRHILVRLSSATSREYTQDKISESTVLGEGGEATKLANVVLALAGATSNITSQGSSRWTFGTIAQQFSDDSSASSFGEIDIMTKSRGTGSDLVPEFKLGIYAYETLYNERTLSTTYGRENAYRLTPGLREDAVPNEDGTITDDMIDENQVLDDTGETVYNYFDDLGIGQIPFGAAVALLEEAKTITDDQGNAVNESNDTFFPRNVIYNKYFNKHNVCVITPNAIELNTQSNVLTEETKTAAAAASSTISGSHVTNENTEGVYVEQFGQLPGFQVDTRNILPQFEHNVLTDSEGQVVLAVRAGTDSYQGIHFITIQRSALSQYGLSQSGDQYVENATQVTDQDVANISQYYTSATPSMSRYPTYGDGEDLTTYVSYNTQQDSEYTSRANEVAGLIQGYNDNLSTFQFQKLVEDGNIQFANDSVKSDMETYVQTSRQSNVDSEFTDWSDNWKEYAEMIEAQEQARAQGAGTGTGSLISEVCAVGYGSHDANDPLWQPGGACYYSTR